MSSEHSKTNVIISIIVPIYKVEAYLEKCIDSILGQTYANFELILVDDGSPDNCPAICDEYSKKDSRIRVIHKENGGLSDARNAGIEIAQGEYLAFVDSDDYVAPDMYECLYNIIKTTDSDMAVCQAVIVGEGDTPVFQDSEKIEIMNSEEAIHQLICRRLFTVNTWNKLFKKELFQAIRFPKGLLYEDLATTYKLIESSQKIAYSPMKKYAYLQRQGSIMNTTGYMVSTDKIHIVREMMTHFTRKDVRAGIVRYLLNDIYKMASCGNLIKNSEYLNELQRFYKEDKPLSNKFLSTKEKVVFCMAVKTPALLQTIYKR